MTQPATGFGTADGPLVCTRRLHVAATWTVSGCFEQKRSKPRLRNIPLAHGEGTAGDFGLGYLLLWKIYPGLGTETFGHTGMGGSIGLADSRQRLGFGYVMNQLGNNGAAHLLGAIYRSLAA